MATFDEISMANDAARALANVSRDMRENAAAYKNFLVRAQQIFAGDAAGYLKTIAAIEAADQTALANGLTALGVTPADAVAFKNTLKTVATAMQTADVSSLAAISAAADQILAAVPVVNRVF